MPYNSQRLKFQVEYINMKEAISRIFEESAQLKVKFARENVDKIIEVVQLIAQVFREGKKVLLFGNGGSATDASHIAAEFVNRFLLERPPLPAIALNTDTAVLTSISNDYDYSQVFSKQVAALGNEGDVAIGISTSGNSPNVMRAIEVAKKNGLKTIVLTGGTGGKLASMADVTFIVPAKATARVQEIHITLGHVICQMVDEELFGNRR
jgi:D-sedoheptulose 7-phosphate isomerase